MDEDTRGADYLDDVADGQWYDTDSNPVRYVTPFRNIRSPLTEHMLRPAGPKLKVIQFSEALSPGDYALLGEWMRNNPSIKLRAYGNYDGSITDLDFLEHFPSVTSFSADILHGLQSIDGLQHLPNNLVKLGLGPTRKKFSLAPLARFTKLRELGLEGKFNDFETLSSLVNLDYLYLRSISMPGAQITAPMVAVSRVSLNFGGGKDLSGLAALPALKNLAITMVSGLSDLSALSNIPTLEGLSLDSLRRVDTLPNMSGLHTLHGVALVTMKGLHDLSPLMTAPNLTSVQLISMGHLVLADMAILANHPTLKSFSAGLGSWRRNEEAERVVGRNEPLE